MSYLEAIVHERYQEALALLDVELKASQTNTNLTTARAAVFFKIGKLDACESDCQSALKVDSDNIDAKYWSAVCLFYRGRFDDAKTFFTSLGSTHSNAPMWLRKCEVESPTKLQVTSKITHNWSQTDSTVTISFHAPGVSQLTCKVRIGERELSVTINQSSGSDYLLALDLFDQINKETSTYELSATGLHVTLHKANEIAWKSLEYKQGMNPTYPTSSKVKKDWSKIDRQCDAELRAEKDTGDAALNGFFKDIYGNADEDTRRAMIKSFQTSGGTVLSTNWGEVRAADYEGKDRPEAPEGQTWSK